MRRTVLCAATAAILIVLADQAVTVGAGSAPVAFWSVDRTGKGDRVQRPATAPSASREAQKPGAREVPDGCETGISPLAKGASGAPPALCVTDAAPLTRPHVG